jgi:hypothetical protein
MAHRNSSRTDGLRQLLLDRHRKSMERWHIPGRRCEFEDALVSGKAVVVSSAQIMSALMHAGLPCEAYTRAGKLGNKLWLLDENDRLTEQDADTTSR